MKILITGATGLVGRSLVPHLLTRNHEIYILTRNKESATSLFPSAKVFEWSPLKSFPLIQGLEEVEAVINLMGENLAQKRWTQKQKQKIINSREKATQNLVAGMSRQARSKLQVFIQASAIGIYQNQHTKGSQSTIVARRFLVEVCEKWEKATEASSFIQRRVVFRFGVILSKEGGMLKKLLPFFKLGLGGPIGRGERMISWIHIKDVTRLITRALEDSLMSGVYNAVSSHPVSNKEFTKALGSSLGKWAFLPIPPLVLRLLYGSMSLLVLDSMKVYPDRLQKLGFQFKIDDIEQALRNL